MGLLDVLNGMQHGPRGPSTPSSQSKGGGMSPMTMAILALLAWKAVKHFSGSQPGSAPQPGTRPGQCQRRRARRRHGRRPRRSPERGPGRIARRRSRRQRLERRARRPSQPVPAKGPWRPANSWVGNGPNKPISPNDLASALGADQIDQLSAQSGLSRDELLQGLSQYLPDAINHLTPDGRLPDENELSGRL